MGESKGLFVVLNPGDLMWSFWLPLSFYTESIHMPSPQFFLPHSSAFPLIYLSQTLSSSSTKLLTRAGLGGHEQTEQRNALHAKGYPTGMLSSWKRQGILVIYSLFKSGIPVTANLLCDDWFRRTRGRIFPAKNSYSLSPESMHSKLNCSLVDPLMFSLIKLYQSYQFSWLLPQISRTSYKIKMRWFIISPIISGPYIELLDGVSLDLEHNLYSLCCSRMRNCLVPAYFSNLPGLLFGSLKYIPLNPTSENRKIRFEKIVHVHTM